MEPGGDKAAGTMNTQLIEHWAQNMEVNADEEPLAGNPVEIVDR